jgi:hypothetical protein
MKKIYSFLEYINEKYNYNDLDEAVFTPNKGQSAVAYLIGLESAGDIKKATLKKSGLGNANLVFKKYGKQGISLYNEAFPENKYKDWSVSIEEIANKIGVPQNNFKMLIKKMSDKFANPEDTSTIFYFDSFYNMNADSLVSYVKNYMSNLDTPQYTRRFKSDMVRTQLPDIFSFLTSETRDILRGENFSLFRYPNVEDDRLTNIKKMTGLYNPAMCSQMIKNGLVTSDLDLTDIDLILYPKSTSIILSQFVNDVNDFIKLQKQEFGESDTPVKVIPNSFKKLKWKDVEVNEEALNKVSDPDAAINFLVTLEGIQEDHGDEDFRFSNHLITIRQRYLIGRFMEIPEEYKGDIANANNILILDDFTTGGNTRNQMKKLVKEQNPNANIKSLSIFQITSN